MGCWTPTFLEDCVVGGAAIWSECVFFPPYSTAAPAMPGGRFGFLCRLARREVTRDVAVNRRHNDFAAFPVLEALNVASGDHFVEFGVSDIEQPTRAPRRYDERLV